MVVEHTTSFTIDREINKVFEAAITFFQTKGFTLENSNKPNTLTFNKKGARFLAMDIRKIAQKLFINLFVNNEGLTVVELHYVIQVSGYATPNDYDKLNAEVTEFKNLLLTTLPAQKSNKDINPTITQEKVEKDTLSLEEKLKKLKELKDAGILSEEEYKEKRDKLLDEAGF